MKIGVPSVEYKSTSAHSLDLIRVLAWGTKSTLTVERTRHQAYRSQRLAVASARCGTPGLPPNRPGALSPALEVGG